MRNRLPKSVYKSVTATIERGAPLDPMVADRRGVRDERLGVYGMRVVGPPFGSAEPADRGQD